MNIFQKDCPECAAPNSVSASRCRCGYCFEADAGVSHDTNEYAQQQDRLYRDYLAARIAQAEAELIVAREQSKADPASTYKASGALLAEQALNALQAEMKQIALRIPATPPPRRPVPAPAPRPAQHRTAAPGSQASVATKPTTTMHAAATPPAPRSTTKIANTPAVVVAAPVPQSKLRSATPVITPPPNTTPRAQTPTRGIKTAATVPTPTPLARKAPPPPIARPSAKPNESFRRAQARKADAIAQSKAVASQPPAPVAKSVTARPSTERAPADIPPIAAAPVVVAKTAKQDCPNCTASVAADAQRCGCGYTFARVSEQVPALTLDATALAILTEGISALGTTRRR